MNKSLAAHYFKLSADQGLLSAQLHFAILLREGRVIEGNITLSAHYFKLAADQGSS
jgi:TPR repeat protein